MLCVLPAVSVEVWHWAEPAESATLEQTEALPFEVSMKLPVPVGLVPPGGVDGRLFAATVAVKVTSSPPFDGLLSEPSEVVVPNRSMFVTVASFEATVSGSLVTTLMPPSAVTWPCVLTCGPPERSVASRAGGLLTVAVNLNWTMLPAGSVGMEHCTCEVVLVQTEVNGAAALAAGAFDTALDAASAEPRTPAKG